MELRVADSDRAGFAGDAIVADGNVVIAGRQVHARVGSESDVAAARSVAEEGEGSVGGVGGAGGVASEGRRAGGGILVRRAKKQRTIAGGGIVTAGLVSAERGPTQGRVRLTGGETKECFLPFGGIPAGITAVGCRSDADNLRGGGQPQTGKQDCNTCR